MKALSAFGARGGGQDGGDLAGGTSPSARRWVELSGVAAALAALVLQGIQPFPIVDDFAYGPLSELWLDPLLFAADDQLRLFANHALVYTAVYALSDITVGVPTGFLIATILLSIASVLAMLAIMRAVGARGATIPLVLALCVGVVLPGIGRGDYGGFIGQSFHHQWVSLCLVAWAFAAGLKNRGVAAGALLGAAAFAQPMTALHGAAILACVWAAQGRDGIRPLLRAAAMSIIVALPVAFFLVSQIMDAQNLPVPPVRQLIDQVYLFRAPHHYALSPTQFSVAGLYAAMGLLSLMALGAANPAMRRPMAGLMAGMCVLLALAWVVHAAPGLSGDHVVLLAVYLLDITRSTPLLFMVSALLFASALEAVHFPRPKPFMAALLAAGILALLILLVNGGVYGWFFAAFGLFGAAFLQRPKVLWAAQGLGAVFCAGVFVSMIVQQPTKAPIESARAALFNWVRSETAPDALFIIPPGMLDFRHYAQRSVYADFKLLSIAQPGQAWLTRKRVESVARPDTAALAARGWQGAILWDNAYHRGATCDHISRLLPATGAQYFILRHSDSHGNGVRRPDCGVLKIAYENKNYSAYALRTGKRDAIVAAR